MLWTLVRKELLTNLLTARLGLAVVFSLVLTTATTWLGSLDYAANRDHYESQVQAAGDRLQAAATWQQVANVWPKAMVPPQPLGILARGLVDTAPLGVWFHVHEVPVSSWPNRSAGYNRFIRGVGEIDFTLIVALLLSFLAVVLGFDGLSDERERGTLRLLLANAVPRRIVVVAKLLGGAISLWVPLVVAFVVSLLIMHLQGGVDAGSVDFVRLFAYLGLCALFLAQVFSLSLMVSTFVRSSSTALILCLVAWLVGGIGFINLLPSLSRYGVYERPSQEFRDARSRLQEAQRERVAAWEASHPPPDEAYLQDVVRDGVRRYVHPEGMAWRLARNEVSIDATAEYADEWFKWWPEALAVEARLIDRWSLLSPLTNYQILAYQLARTTFEDTWHIGAAARDYRRTWLEYLRSRRAFSSPRWFSDDPPSTTPLIPDPEAVTAQMLDPDSDYMRARLEWARQQDATGGDRPGPDLTGFPVMDGRAEQRTLAESLAAMTPGLLVLVLTFGLSVLITFRRFDRMEPF